MTASTIVHLRVPLATTHNRMRCRTPTNHLFTQNNSSSSSVGSGSDASILKLKSLFKPVGVAAMAAASAASNSFTTASNETGIAPSSSSVLTNASNTRISQNKPTIGTKNNVITKGQALTFGGKPAVQGVRKPATTVKQSSSLTAPGVAAVQPQTFRPRSVWLDTDAEMNQFWTLKRANPVFDSDDEDEDDLVDELSKLYASPSKRQRSTFQLDYGCHQSLNDGCDFQQLTSSSSSITPQEQQQPF